MTQCTNPGCTRPLAGGARDYCAPCGAEQRTIRNRENKRNSRAAARAAAQAGTGAPPAGPALPGPATLSGPRLDALLRSAEELVDADDAWMRAFLRHTDHGADAVPAQDAATFTAEHDARVRLLEAVGDHVEVLSELLGPYSDHHGLRHRLLGQLFDVDNPDQ